MGRWCIPATLAVFFIALIIFTSPLRVSADLQSREPILIDGDDNFIPANGVVGGSGTENDPYIIENWVIDASSAHGIHIRNTRSYFIIRNVLVRNGYPSYNGIYFENVQNGRIENVISTNNANGIFLVSSSRNTISNSTVNGNYYGITFAYSSLNEILNNILEGNRYGLWIDSSSTNTISGNIVEYSTEVGIVFRTGQSSTVSNNIIRNNPFGIQIYSNSSMNTISNNTVMGNSWYGIYVESSTYNTISKNTVVNGNRGIHLQSSSHYSKISNNVVRNTAYGIFIVSSNGNTISGNIVENSTSYGIYLGTSTNNILFRNYLRNTNNAYDGGLNYWDNGGMGNWWSDWQPPTHPDSNRDGIVDERRQVTGSNYDNYPLVIPVQGSLHIPIYIDGDDNFTPLNGVFLGSGTENDPYIIENWVIDSSSAHGIHIRNTRSYFIIRNCLVENGGRGILMENVANGRVENCVIRNSDHGFYLLYSSNNVLSNNILNNNYGIGIYLAYSTGNSVCGNIVENQVHGGYSDTYGSYLFYSSNNTISGNGVRNNKYGIYLSSSGNNILSGNAVENNSSTGIWLIYSDNNTISNSTVRNNLSGGINIHQYSDNNIISNNIIENNWYSGIFLYSNMYNVISGNTVENTSVGGAPIGIYLERSSYATVSNNTLRNNAYAGIHVSSVYNKICQNRIANSFVGLYLDSGSYNEISYNTMANNSRGIYFNSSNQLFINNNTVHHNLFYNNSESNAYNAGSNNAWDNGSEGNWWGDWQWENGLVDANNDGVFENARSISGGATDRYPLSLVNLRWPENGATEVLYSVLEFTAPCLENYTVEVDDNPDFGSKEYEGTVQVLVENFSLQNTVSQRATGLSQRTTYYWRVKAWANGFQAYSQTWQFTTGPLPTRPSLRLPENGAYTVDNTPDFEWENGENATRHRLLVDNDPDFGSPEIDVVLLAGSSYTVPDENSLTNTTYYWKVAAVNDYGENWSEVRVFDVLKAREPIFINGDVNFTPANGVNGGGDGTEHNPYVIRNWVIDASSAHGIHIRNTRSYFIIRNCLIENMGGHTEINGIRMENVRNGRIENVKVRRSVTTYPAIRISDSSKNVVSDSLIEEVRRGIVLSSSSGNTISGNRVMARDSSVEGITLWSSDNNKISGNTVGNFSQNGVSLSSSNNNEVSGNIVENSGYRCVEVYGENNTISGNLLGNLLGGAEGVRVAGNHNRVLGNTMKRCGYAGVNNVGNFTIISGNTITDGHNGINNYGNATIENNTVENWTTRGICIYYCSATISGNILRSTGLEGMFIIGSSGTISNNIFENIPSCALYMYGSSGILLENNRFIGNRLGLLLDQNSNTTLRRNIFENNLEGFGVRGYRVSDFVHDIDNSNTVDGRPIFYSVGENNQELDGQDFGYIGLVSCENVAVRNMRLRRNYQGLLLADVRSALVENVAATDSDYGLYVFSSENITVLASILGGNIYGVGLGYSSDFRILGNRIENSSSTGVDVYESSGITISGNRFVGNETSVYCYNTSGLVAENNLIRNGESSGLELCGDTFTVRGNVIENVWYGIYVQANNTVIENNIIRGCGEGIDVSYSDSVFIENNLLENSSYYDIYIWGLTNATLRRNRMFSNRAGLFIGGESVEHFMLDIDNSNLVGAGPVLYLKGEENNLVIDRDNAVGWLGLVNSDNILVRNLRLETVMFAFSANSVVENVLTENSSSGIYLMYSENIKISGSGVRNCQTGFYTGCSENITILGNTVENCGTGIQFFDSRDSLLENNVISGSEWYDIYFWDSTGNTLIANVYKTSQGIPGMSGVQCFVSDGSARITWMTSESSTTLVEYGLDTSYENSITDGVDVYHEVFISGLSNGTLYHFRAVSQYAGNVEMSADMTFVPVHVHIESDSEFTPDRGVTGGSGTENDPYIIENWWLDAYSDIGAFIRNTTSHFILRNIFVNGFGSGFAGIKTENVVNGRIENVKVLNSGWGIYIQSSEQMEVNGAICQNNSNDGIGIYGCRNVTVSNAICVNNYEGIYLEDSENCVISDSLCELNEDAGIYIDDSENITVSGSICLNNSAGGIVVYSDRVTLSGNICENNDEHGIYLSSSGSVLENNRCSGNGQSGIYLYSSQNNTLSRNTTTGNSGCGIELENSNLNTLSRNVSSGNGLFGIALSNSTSNRLEANTYENSFMVPGISAVSVHEVTFNSATVLWTTLENSTSAVEYGTTPSFGSIRSVGGMTTAHSLTLTGLAAGTTYYFRVRSTNESLNEEISETFSFTTLSPPPPGPPPRAATRLSVEPSMFTLTSGGSVTLTATLTDADGRPVRNRNVIWTATAGSLSPTSGLTDNLGRVTVVYTAPSVDRPENVVVTASFAGDSTYEGCENSATGQIFSSPKPVVIVIQSPSATVRSGENLTLTAILLSDGQPVAGRTLAWEASAGSITRYAVTDESGTCAAVFSAPSVPVSTRVSITVRFAGDGYLPGENSLILTVLPMAGPELAGRVREFVENAGVRLGAEDLSALESSVLENMVGTCISILENGELLTAFRREDLSVSVRRMRPGEIVELDVEGSAACVVILNLASGLLPENFRVLVDGQPASPASSYADVLNPLDENIPEYVILQGSGWVHVVVSIPGFSARTITLGALEKPTGVPWVIVGALIVVVVALIILLSGRRVRRKRQGPL